MSDSEIAADYVTNAAWHDRPARHGSHSAHSRADSIDEIADQFERAPGARLFWAQDAVAWPQRASGPRTTSFRRHAGGARLAG